MTAFLNAVFFIDCLVLVVVPIFFIFNEVYEDGFFGRVGLGGIAFFSGMFVGEFLISFYENGEVLYELLPQTVALVTSMTVFIAWHLFRWHSKVLRKRLVDPEATIPQ